jgi:hypothetical protein
MNDQNDTTRRRADDLLRQWGAGQAADQAARDLSARPAAQQSAPRQRPAARRARPSGILRWAPVGVAAALLLGAGVLFVESLDAPKFADAPAAYQSPGPVEPESRPVDLAGQLAAARAETADARNTLSQALADSLAQKHNHDLAIKALQAEFATRGVKFTSDRAEWKTMESKLSSLLAKSEESVSQANEQLLAARMELAVAKAAGIKTPADADEVKKLKARLAVAIEEMRRQRITFRTANTDRDRAKLALASLKSSHKAALDQIRRVYLAAAAPNRKGLIALQEAIKNRGLLKRCVALQRRARNDADRKLLGRAEVVLTRLGLLNPADQSAVRTYVAQLSRTDLVASLDATLGAAATDAATQDWLFETKLILTGAQRVI